MKITGEFLTYDFFYQLTRKAVKDSVLTEFQIDDSRSELISPMSSRQKSKDSQSLGSRQYEQKMEKTIEAVTKFFQRANNDSHSKVHYLQECTDLAASTDNIRMSIKNLEDDTSSLEKKKTQTTRHIIFHRITRKKKRNQKINEEIKP